MAIIMVRPGRGARTHVSRWLPCVRALLRPVDKMALYSLDAVALLLPEASLDAALEMARAMIGAAEPGVPLLAGVAAFPDTATSAEKLLESCWTALQSAAPGRPVISQASGPWTWGGEAGHGRAFERPVVESPAMKQVFATVERLARSSIPVLLQGETGTGNHPAAAGAAGGDRAARTGFLHQASAASERRILGIEPAALALLQSYAWSGNVRELRNAIERAVVIAEGGMALGEGSSRARPVGEGAFCRAWARGGEGSGAVGRSGGGR